MSIIVCRICLATNVRMYCVDQTSLVQLYEKLVASKMNTDHLPERICYICHSQLLRCRRFSDMACKSEKILNDMFQNCSQVTPKDMRQLNSGSLHNLSLSSVQAISTSDSNETAPTVSGNQLYICMNDSASTVKEESVKQESETRHRRRKSFKEEKIAVKMESASDDEYIELEDVNDDVEMEERLRNKEKLLLKRGNEESDTETHFYCYVCGKKFDTELLLVSHLRSHSAERQKYNCEKCDKAFFMKNNLRQHMKICNVEKPFPCSACSEAFATKDQLKMHTKTHVKEKIYVCDRCSKKFNRKDGLKVHMRIHTGEKPFDCQICSKKFKQLAHFNKHMEIHAGLMPFACEVCGKTARTSSNLKAHMRSHTGERPYACTKCDMAFSLNTTLKKHMQLHTEVKPYACTRCYMSFIQESSLTKHMRLHTAERPYSCDKCNKAFTDARNLKDHMVVHSGERPYACDRCTRSFKRRHHLKKHLVICKASST